MEVPLTRAIAPASSFVRLGSFQRSFPVPHGVAADKVEASFKNGVLTVTMPKTPEARKKEKRIEIQQG